MKVKTILSISLLMRLLLAAPVGAAVDPRSLGEGGGANNNPHNLSSSSSSAIHAPAGGENEICIFCHTPHGASSQSTLWNRPALGQPDTSYPLYGGQLVIKEDFPGSPAGSQNRSQYKNDGSVTYPNGASRMCMSCHDGVTAVGEVLNGGTLANLTMSVQGTINLSASHPISFVYDDAVKNDINAARGANTYQIPTTPSRAPRDAQSRMQCTTCHEPHLNTQVGTYPYPFWRNAGVGATPTDDYNATCNECHVAAPTNPNPLHQL